MTIGGKNVFASIIIFLRDNDLISNNALSEAFEELNLPQEYRETCYDNVIDFREKSNMYKNGLYDQTNLKRSKYRNIVRRISKAYSELFLLAAYVVILISIILYGALTYYINL